VAVTIGWYSTCCRRATGKVCTKGMLLDVAIPKAYNWPRHSAERRFCAGQLPSMRAVSLMQLPSPLVGTPGKCESQGGAALPFAQ